MKRFVIAGVSSGAGKTTVSLGLMAAFMEDGLSVQPFKTGPDFIDPLFHTKICGRSSRNLDGWLMGREAVLSSFQRASLGADICVVEGVMGLFDGYDARSEAGSTAEIAKWLHAPVILTVDARSMARSAGALVRGFETFDSALNVAGVIFNRMGSERHMKWLTQAVEDHCGARCLGGLLPDADLTLPERHLGLSTDQVGRIDEAWIRRLALGVRQGMDLSGLLDLAEAGPLQPYSDPSGTPHVGKGVRIGVAMDEAFCFYYEDNLDLLRDMGAELIFFSPLHDLRLPGNVDGLYLGGGYPEVYAEHLSQNQSLLMEVREAA
ncbi:MAG: cobyrinate a,c-diamide synthase, partial [Nitrospirae bacterium CG17_big_fil_post_rev_8_21_14_2_50_50_9]